MKASLVCAAVLAVAAFAAGATAATGWRVFATATDRGEYSTYANANAKVVSPKALALRVIGPATDVSWVLTCQGETKARKAGVSIVAVNTADTCDVSGSAIGHGGTVRVQLLRR